MFLSDEAIARIGFAAIGTNVKIDSDARFFGAGRLSIGSNVRIDAQVIVSCPGPAVRIGDWVHIGVGCLLFGGGGLTLEPCAGLSPRVTLMSETDDFTSGHLIGPTFPDDLRQVRSAPIHLEAHAVVGTGSVVLPGVRIGRGATVGALSLVREDVEPLAVMAGTPAKRIGTRDEARLSELEARLRARGQG